jgi:hypothetical protein
MEPPVTRDDFGNIRFVRKLALALDQLLAEGVNVIGSLPEAYKKANEDYLKDEPNLRATYLHQRRMEYWGVHVKNLDMSQVYVQDAPGVDLHFEFDATRPYHEWGIYFSDRDIAQRKLLVPKGIHLVLLGPGTAPRGVYQLTDLPPLPIAAPPSPPRPPGPIVIRSRKNRDEDREESRRILERHHALASEQDHVF